MFYAYDRKNANDDNDGCNENYDGNFDYNDDKNDRKQTNIKSVGKIFSNFRDCCNEKQDQKIRAGASPPLSGNAQKKKILY